MDKLKSYPTLTALVAVGLVGASWFSFQNGMQYGAQTVKNGQANQSQVLAAGTRIGPESIVKSQQALAVGEITKKDGETVTIKGDDGKETSFKLSPNLSIYSISTTSATPPKPTQDITALKLNKKALIDLQLQGEEYLITNISYIPN